MLERAMVCFYHYRLKANPPCPFAKCSDNGIGFLFSGGPVLLSLGQFATVKCHWNPFAFPLLFQDCTQGKVTSISAKDKGFVGFDTKNL
jgi:hypothetical protein